MKIKILFILFILTRCTSPEQQSTLDEADQKKRNEFESAQKTGDTARIYEILSASQNQDLFCALIHITNPTFPEFFLQKKGFVQAANGGYIFQYDALCQFKSEDISCLIERISRYPVDENELQSGLKIAGINLCDSLQRQHFIRTEILKSSDFAATELLFLTNLIKLDPSNKYYESGLRSIVDLSDKSSITLFLKKSGFIKFDRHSDEYTSFHPEKIAHLSENTRRILLEKADIQSISE